MRLILVLIIYLGGLLALNAQSTQFFLIGDTGDPTLPSDSNLAFLEQISSDATESDVLIFLGDNIYPEGLPDKDDPERKEMEARLNIQLDLIKRFKGKAFIIPGNHDWAQTRSYGWRYIQNQQLYIQRYLQDENVFFPKNGCPGPIEIEINEKIVLIILDTQYFLHPWDKPRKEDGCEVGGSIESLDLLEDAIERNSNRHIIVAGHHPVYSVGPHSTRLGISVQDAKNPRYKIIRKTLAELFSKTENLIYVSGHEHSLQYITRDAAHYVISGSGSKTSEIKKPGDADFAAAKKGFGEIIYEETGEVILKFWDGGDQKKLLEKHLYRKNVMTADELLAARPDFKDSVVRLAGNENLSLKSKSQKFWMGNSYRREWSTPIEVPVFDIEKEHGGLEILKKGGGGQTRSLRLENEEGRQWVLRSVQKWPYKVIPLAFRKTFAVQIVNDQMSSSNPYGALVVPTLAEALGIYHTNPSLVFIPDDPNFGIYRSQFAGLMMLYEERPNDEAAKEAFFGNADEIESTPKVLEELREDNDNSVDQSFVLRNRMFDMWIGDYDRHDDQWRWAEYKYEDDKKIYRPIPRDRDQAFFRAQGLVPAIVSRKWAFPMFQGFEEDMRWTPGFNWQARWFDRSFLNELEWNEWQTVIDDLQAGISDDLIEEAIPKWPQEIYDLSGKQTEDLLKIREPKLDKWGREHYEFLAKRVDVTGSDKHELFTVERINNEETKVVVRKRKKDGELEHIMYDRVFKTDETKEIVLYGFDGEDIFEISGQVNSGPRIRIVGGPDKDKIIDESNISGWSKKNIIYDKPGTDVIKGNDTKLKLSEEKGINSYDRLAYKFDKLFPLLDANYNRDDGIFLGGGFLWQTHGFRKDPFKQTQYLSGSVALATGAFEFEYKGVYTDVVKNWDLTTSLEVIQPFGVSNFFGFGNDTDFDVDGDNEAAGFEDPIDFYRVRYERNQALASLSTTFWRYNKIEFGATLIRYENRERPGYFISDTTNGLDQNDVFDPFFYTGIQMNYSVDSRDLAAMPSKGVYFELNVSPQLALSNMASNFIPIEASFSHYFEFRIPMSVVVANRFGFKHIFGEAEFFNSSTLGMNEIRGLRRNRFTGQTAFYHNIDMRLKLFSFNTYIFPGSFGLVAFHDLGRVWLEEDNSDEWHNGYGGGIWISPLDLVVASFMLGQGDEELLPIVKLGFHF